MTIALDGHAGMTTRMLRALGWLSALLWSGLLITGVLLFFLYVPGPGSSFDGVDSTVDTGLWPTTLSGWLQDIHLWLGVGAVLSSLVIAILALDVKRNFVVSFLVFVLTVVAFGTGLLLPWDSLALQAVEVGTGIRGYLPLWEEDRVVFVLMGGVEVGVATLQRWLVIHAVIIPLLVAVVAAVGRRRSAQRVGTPGSSAFGEPSGTMEQ